jgi:hypothetical protein
LAEWGIAIDNVEGIFSCIDQNGGGQILFNEFANWVSSTL